MASTHQVVANVHRKLAKAPALPSVRRRRDAALRAASASCRGRPATLPSRWSALASFQVQFADQKRKKLPCRGAIKMRRTGLEPARNIIPLGPQPSVSTNFTTAAYMAAFYRKSVGCVNTFPHSVSSHTRSKAMYRPLARIAEKIGSSNKNGLVLFARLYSRYTKANRRQI
jgi:hypothetical protein